MEHEAEREEYRIQSQQMSLERKVRRGICWWPVSVGRSWHNSLNQLVVELTQDNPQDIDHQFEYGRPVVFFVNPPLQGGGGGGLLPHTCTVSYVDGERMVVVLPSLQALTDLQRAQGLGVQLYFDETSYRTMFGALDEAIRAKGNRLAELRDLFAGQGRPGRFTFRPQAFPWLNVSQQEAVNQVLWAKDVAVVHGPPGTGKTTTLVEAIYETLRRETQVLVCAQSNMAVDWISERLVDHGVPVLRIGNPTRVNDKMLSFTYERLFEAHPDYPELWSVRKTIRQLREQRKRGESMHQKLARLRERAEELEMRIREALFAEARVVACTLVGADNKILVGQHFPTLFIDEAAQALEPACWIAIRRAGRVILAGDHQQLPPTVKCYDALRQGLGVTLMERIVQNLPSVVTLLTTQYRMHEQIMQFSSQEFYDGNVEAHPSVRHRSILDLDSPIQWVDSPSPEAFVGATHGRINKEEAQLTIDTLRNYIEKIGRERYIEERLDVGIISPYRLQAQYIRSLIKHDDQLRPLRQTITVQTVDGFQGQERDIVLISLVRSNEHGQIGFLSDLRRMNVAMTRARMKLIIVGHRATLAHHPFYRRLLQYIEEIED